MYTEGKRPFPPPCGTLEQRERKEFIAYALTQSDIPGSCNLLYCQNGACAFCRWSWIDAIHLNKLVLLRRSHQCASLTRTFSLLNKIEGEIYSPFVISQVTLDLYRLSAAMALCFNRQHTEWWKSWKGSHCEGTGFRQNKIGSKAYLIKKIILSVNHSTNPEINKSVILSIKFQSLIVKILCRTSTVQNEKPLFSCRLYRLVSFSLL